MTRIQCSDLFHEFLIDWNKNWICLKNDRRLTSTFSSAVTGSTFLSHTLTNALIAAPFPSCIFGLNILKRMLSTDTSPRNFQHIFLGSRFSESLSECGAHLETVARSEPHTPKFFITTGSDCEKNLLKTFE